MKSMQIEKAPIPAKSRFGVSTALLALISATQMGCASINTPRPALAMPTPSSQYLVLNSQGGKQFSIGERTVLLPFVPRGIAAGTDMATLLEGAVRQTSNHRGSPSSVRSTRGSQDPKGLTYSVTAGQTGFQVACQGACDDWWIAIDRGDNAGRLMMAEMRYNSGLPVVLLRVPTYHSNYLNIRLIPKRTGSSGDAFLTVIEWPTWPNFRGGKDGILF